MATTKKPKKKGLFSLQISDKVNLVHYENSTFTISDGSDVIFLSKNEAIEIRNLFNNLNLK